MDKVTYNRNVQQLLLKYSGIEIRRDLSNGLGSDTSLQTRRRTDMVTTYGIHITLYIKAE
jgi:hypothetical protein